MKWTYDEEVDAFYLALTDIGEGGVFMSIPVNTEIVLDFDKHSRLVGIEVLCASQLLPEDVMKRLRGAMLLHGGQTTGSQATMNVFWESGGRLEARG